MSEYSKEFLDLLESVTAKRPRTVIQHILQHGYFRFLSVFHSNNSFLLQKVSNA